MRVIVRLTPKGRTAFEEHRKYHRDLDGKILDVVKEYSQQEREVICRFLQEVQKKWT